MKDLLTLIMAASFAATLSTSSMAQETDGEDANAEPDINQQADADFPTAGDQEPQVGDLYPREEIGAWTLRCIKAEEVADETCVLYQLMRDVDDNPVAEATIQSLPKGGKAVAGVEFSSPLGTLLTANVVLRVDSGQSAQYPYSWCDQLGCHARFGLTAEELDALKKGANGFFTIRAFADQTQPIELTMSLTGFTKAWDAIAKE